ncbi:glycosyl hydrolase family 95 catalytic domain-containing protein [Mitsuaria sp. TWR114]|uniref:glycosyl hydrolase family 95 catalytic domain-containing protein n=1 Tax=Mitsuaria sp. TWR114 TaxID=2601731 RepID=UPI0038573DC8
MPTGERLLRSHRRRRDPELEALHAQYGRYLLIASSRDSLPANLQGLWNDSLTPPWSSDYHTNINVQMNYWPSERQPGGDGAALPRLRPEPDPDVPARGGRGRRARACP